MKKVLCPKCDNDITFNEDRYEKMSLCFSFVLIAGNNSMCRLPI